MAELMASGRVGEHVMLHELTTYKLGGPARWFIEPAGLDELLAVGPFAGPLLVVGRGSNLVVSDDGFEGLVIQLGSSFSYRTFEDDRVVAGAATPLPALARAAAKAGRAGLEFMVGIPGSVGGAVRMNAGCFGTETADVLVSATIVDLQTCEVLAADPGSLEMSYRHAALAPTQVVVEAVFRTEPGAQAESEDRMREITRWRRDHQPGGTLNAGSVFRNPPGDSAGALIDRLGLKGLSVGGASVSKKHANFFVAEKSATASDVRNLVLTVQKRVRDETGITLIPELTFAGFD